MPLPAMSHSSFCRDLQSLRDIQWEFQWDFRSKPCVSTANLADEHGTLFYPMSPCPPVTLVVGLGLGWAFRPSLAAASLH